MHACIHAAPLHRKETPAFSAEPAVARRHTAVPETDIFGRCSHRGSLHFGHFNHSYLMVGLLLSRVIKYLPNAQVQCHRCQLQGIIGERESEGETGRQRNKEKGRKKVELQLQRNWKQWGTSDCHIHLNLTCGTADPPSPSLRHPPLSLHRLVDGASTTQNVASTFPAAALTVKSFFLFFFNVVLPKHLNKCP